MPIKPRGRTAAPKNKNSIFFKGYIRICYLKIKLGSFNMKRVNLFLKPHGREMLRYKVPRVNPEQRNVQARSVDFIFNFSVQCEIQSACQNVTHK